MTLTVFLAEYLRRVQTKAFILTTLLGPLVLAAIGGGAVAVIAYSAESDASRERRLAVVDESGLILPELRRREHESFRLVSAPTSLEDAKRAVIDGDTDVLVVLPPDMARPSGATEASAYVAEKQSVNAEQALRRFVLDAVRDVRLAEFDLPTEVRDTINERLALTAVAIDESGEEESASAASSMVVGALVGALLLMLVWIYGSFVMQATMEEKSSRMAEILVSSVRPFEILLGKILAVGGMAVTQLLVWFAMLLAIGAAFALLVPMEGLAELGMATAAAEGEPLEFALPPLRFDVLLVVLVMLPLGYLINASLFGALGGMYESPQEAQVAVGIAMSPMIFAMLMVQTVGLAPNGVPVVVASFFPFTAPIMLPTRMLVSDVPIWQVLLSMALCAGSALGVIWLAGRAFRASLLIYGKKFKPRDIWQILTAD